jgi:hypothetical protein
MNYAPWFKQANKAEFFVVFRKKNEQYIKKIVFLKHIAKKNHFLISWDARKRARSPALSQLCDENGWLTSGVVGRPWHHNNKKHSIQTRPTLHTKYYTRHNNHTDTGDHTYRHIQNRLTHKKKIKKYIFKYFYAILLYTWEIVENYNENIFYSYSIEPWIQPGK